MKKIIKSISCFAIAALLAVGFGFPNATVKAASPLDGTVIIGDTAFTIDALMYCKKGDKVYNDFLAKLTDPTKHVYINLSGAGWQDAFTSATVPDTTVFQGISTVNVENQTGDITAVAVDGSTDDLTVIDIN